MCEAFFLQSLFATSIVRRLFWLCKKKVSFAERRFLLQKEGLFCKKKASFAKRRSLLQKEGLFCKVFLQRRLWGDCFDFAKRRSLLQKEGLFCKEKVSFAKRRPLLQSLFATLIVRRLFWLCKKKASPKSLQKMKMSRLPQNTHRINRILKKTLEDQMNVAFYEEPYKRWLKGAYSFYACFEGAYSFYASLKCHECHWIREFTYGVATISRLLKIIGLFCRI